MSKEAKDVLFFILLIAVGLLLFGKEVLAEEEKRLCLVRTDGSTYCFEPEKANGEEMASYKQEEKESLKWSFPEESFWNRILGSFAGYTYRSRR